MRAWIEYEQTQMEGERIKKELEEKVRLAERERVERDRIEREYMERAMRETERIERQLLKEGKTKKSWWR